MSAALWILIILAALIFALWLWLAVLPLGLGVIGKIGPEGAEHAVKGRVITSSPFAKIVRALRGKGADDPTSGICVLDRAHFSDAEGGPYLICHELGHLIRAAAVGNYRYTFRMATDRAYAAAEEAWCHTFALENQSDGMIRILFERMVAAQGAKPDVP